MSSTPSPQDWLILQCQACGSPMKVRAETAAGQRVACPTCRTPLAVQVPGSTPPAPEFSAAMPQDRDRTVIDPPQRLPDDYQRDEEFTPTLGSQLPEEPPPQYVADDAAFLGNLKSTDDYQSGGHVKVKKRRKRAVANEYEVLADWDTALESLPEAELYSDPWTRSVPIPEEVIKEKTRDFVVAEHDEDGNTVRRVKRVRKRRLFSWAQLFFRRLSLGMRVLAISAVAVIGLGGMTWGIIILREKFKSVTYDDVAAEARPGQEHLAQQDESSALEAVSAFLAAAGTEAKLPFVRLPNRVRPLMEKYYSKVEDKPLEAVEVTGRNKIVTQGAYFVLLEVQVKNPAAPGGYGSTRHFAVEEREDKIGHRTYLVDWETAVEWREMSFEEFKKTRPRGNVPFRVKLRATNYYNHSFTDEKKWLATEVYYPRAGVGNETLFHGYMERNSPVFRQMGPVVEGGYNPAVIVNLRYPDNAISSDQVIIDSLVHDSWFFVEDTAQGKKPGSPTP